MLSIGYTTAVVQDVQCISTVEEPDSCYIITPIYLKPTDTLNFINAENLTNVTHFELKAFTNFVSFPTIVLDTFPLLEDLILAGFAFVSTLAPTDFAHATNLRTLDLKANELTSIPYSVFSSASNLVNLDLSYNAIWEIEDLAFNGLTQLEKLDLSNNRLPYLKHFTFSGIPSLKYLDISHNKIKLIENAALYLPSLTHLYFKFNEVKTLPDGLFGIGPSLTSALTIVDLSDNKLTHIGSAIYGLKQLQWLNLTNNKNIDDLNITAFSNLYHLEELYLTSAGSIIQPIVVPTLGDAAIVPLTSQSPLKILHLGKDKITNPDLLRQLSVFSQLEELNLENNKIIYIDGINQLKAWFPSLKTIEIGGNKLNCNWLNDSIPLFQAAGVNVYTIKKSKTWFTGTAYEKKLIDATDCFDLETIFNNILDYMKAFGKIA